MMSLRRVSSVILACAFAVAGLAGCSGRQGPQCGLVGCSGGGGGPPHEYALDVTAAGSVRWQVRLPAASTFGAMLLSPLAVGAVAVFAEGSAAYGFRLADGHQVWSRTMPSLEDINGMWRWQNLVIMLTGSGWLTGLDASTGHARWRLGLGGGVSSPGGAYLTADGGVAIMSGDTLEVVDLATGRVRWTRPAGYPPDSGMSSPSPMAVAGGAVLTAVNGHLTSYNDRTGQILWTDALMPIQLAASLGTLGLQAAAGLVYLTGAVKQGASPNPVQVLLAISAADGRLKWRFATGAQGALWGTYPGLIWVTSSSGGTWQDYDLDPATGRVRWQTAATLYSAITTPAGIVTVNVPGSDGTDQISVRDTLTGQTRWSARLSLGSQQALALTVLTAGPFLVVPTGGPASADLLTAFRLSDGHRAWQITTPDPVSVPPTAVPGGMLVNSAIAVTEP